MSKHTPIVIGGIAYDAKTGMPIRDYQVAETSTAPVAKSPVAVTHHKQSAADLHARTRRSQTLRREHVKKPAAKVAPRPAHPSAKRSPMIAHFASHHHAGADISTAKKPAAKAPQSLMRDIGPAVHPAQAKHKLQQQHRAVAVAKPTLPPAKVIKERAIAKALDNSSSHKKEVKQRWRPKTWSIASASIAIVLMAGYFTYLTLPGISVRVAATQAGIAATYPSYHPQGYRLNGPVAYADGEVKMQFNSNTNSGGFTVNQTKSSWDSSALLANYVEPAADDDYVTYTDSGLTIYVYDKGAAWVSNGILHTIEGDATLSNDQVRRIATSM